ncbi:hydroxymethylbilane synthase [Georgenia yuyongxinii]|uniref:Hydroxymethylbilane synthase n=1 Tax=Georgenia yuyongxinii TaxID=2589797 RepID=A0A5B8C883_9MICO|nr:hydroxymethylbilane synthase [Georgenia yuyongxinii]QDC26250.1 hydroxymethylbilane synthase [Georgenia yuyongxinii]
MKSRCLDFCPSGAQTDAVSTSTPLRIGTRGSELALTQTTTVAESLAAASGRDVELVTIRTEGDRSTASLASLGGTGVFAAALREAVLASTCDVAVHSLKDLPTAPVTGLSIGALPARADHRDALCARDGLTLATLPAGARVGTGSPRRAAQLRLARPDLEVVDIRGNVGTRLGRVGADLDAVVLAQAGLVRLGLLDHVTETLEPDVMLSAPGQGALAVECRTADLAGPLGETLRTIDDPSTRLAVVAERTLLAALEAGCAAPVAAWARVVPGTAAEPASLVLRAGAFDPAGRDARVRTAVVDLPGSPERSGAAADGVETVQGVGDSLAQDLGRTTALRLLDDGAAEIAGLPTAGGALAAAGQPDVPGVLDGDAGA